MRSTPVRRFAWLGGLLASAALAAQTPATLAVVGDRTISIDDFRAVLREARGVGRMESTLATLTPAGREKLLATLVDTDLLALGARDRGLETQPDVKFLIEQAVDQVLARKFVERVAQEVAVTDEALKAFYDAHHELFVTPTSVKVRQIVLKSRQEAEAVLADAKAGNDFAALATARSVDPTSAAKGGDIGWVPRGVMVKPFEDLIFSLKKGEVGGVVETHLGFHVVKIEDVRQPQLPPFESVRAAVKEKKISAALETAKAELSKRHPVTIHQDVLATLGR